MSKYSIENLKGRINKFILRNFMQLITGDILNGILHDVVDSIIESIIASKVYFSHQTHTNVQSVIDFLLQFKIALETEKGNKGFSTNDYTTEEKSKLASLNEKFQGTFTSLAQLQAAHPAGLPGQYADVDTGPGNPVQRYNWDSEDGWQPGNGGGTIADTDQLPEGTNNKYFSTARAVGSVLGSLAGLILNVEIVAEDTIKQALGKLQGQLNAKQNAVDNTLLTIDKSIPGAINEVFLGNQANTNSRGLKTLLRQNQFQNYSEILPADSTFLSISFKNISGDPLVTVGTTPGGTEILGLQQIVNSYTYSERRDFSAQQPIYISVFGGTVTSNLEYFNRTFTPGQVAGEPETLLSTPYTNVNAPGVTTVGQMLDWMAVNGGGGGSTGGDSSSITADNTSITGDRT